MFFNSDIIHIKADVLVIGGGGAGLRAAIAAKKAGNRVVLVSKGKIGLGNNTVIAGGAVAAATGWRDPADNPEIHAEDTIRSGRFIANQDMVKKMTEMAPGEIVALDRFGVPFARTEDGKFRISKTPGHSYPRQHYTINRIGKDFTSSLIKTARQMGVEFIEDVYISKLLTTSAGLTGAAGFSRKLELFCLSAKALVLATGGGGRVLAATNNPPGMTADGYALLLREGLPLHNMEMVQFYPTHLFEPGLANKLITYEAMVYNAGGIIRNASGEDIIVKYRLWDDRMTRDNVCRAMMTEILEGNSEQGCLELDLSHFSEEQIERVRNILPPKMPMGKRKFKVMPVAHFFMGGVPINLHAQTGRPGLFAAGEVTVGVHGANRLGGNALAEAWTFGKIAGENALQIAETQKTSSSVIKAELDDEMARLKASCTSEDHTIDALKHLAQLLRQEMWTSAGPIRTGSKMAAATGLIASVKNELLNLRANSAVELRGLEELRNMTLVAETVLTAAILRQESRGAHYREDFPQEEKQWQGITRVRLVADRIEAGFIPLT